MNEHELKNNIMKYAFFALDLNLYLDNFPDNKEATEDFKEVSSRLRALMNKYEKTYGPLINAGFAYEQNPEKWCEQPWPWESGM